MTRIRVDDIVKRRWIETIQLANVEIPHRTQMTHLQFRRFAGCPMCTLHLRSFIQRNHELAARGIQVVAVFHSSRKAMLEHHAVAPFALIADPTKSLYRAFAVDESIRSVADPRSWFPAARGILQYGISLPGRDESVLGLPADFLIGREGRVLACKYGRHAYDQWTVDEVLALAQSTEERI